MQAVDVHTHCFPDFIAEKAVQFLSHKNDMTRTYAYHNGTLAGLSESMDRAGITKSVIQSIATKPAQVENILQWSIQIKSEKFEPFISIHPDYKNFNELLKKAKESNILGVKVHPHYQEFMADDEKVFPLYECFCKYNFIVLFHSGNDAGFPGQNNTSVVRMKKIIQKFPGMKMILAHYGAYQEWDRVYDELAGENVYFETSFALEEAGEEMFLKILHKHSADKILFGTDSPWMGQKNAADLLKKAAISPEIKEKIFYKNYFNLIRETAG